MRTVLYTMDFEPITVVNLHPYIERLLRERKSAFVAPILPVERLVVGNGTPFEIAEMPKVEIMGEVVRFRGGKEIMLLVTPDEEFALLLKSEFLPGQWREVHEHERNGFARGILYALERGIL